MLVTARAYIGYDRGAGSPPRAHRQGHHAAGQQRWPEGTSADDFDRWVRAASMTNWPHPWGNRRLNRPPPGAAICLFMGPRSVGFLSGPLVAAGVLGRFRPPLPWCQPAVASAASR